MISVEVGTPDLALSRAFEALGARATPNAFMHPAALCAAAQGGVRIHVLAAWHRRAGERVLTGFWALRERRVAPFCPRFLAAPPYEYAFVASPVIDPEHRDAVLAGFLDTIAKDARLPKVVRLKLLDGESAAPLMAALGARGGRVLTLSESARPFLSGEADRKRSGSTGKKLRQDWNRLGALGAAEVVNAREAEAVRAAFDVFLEMELRSWKGANGTALLCNGADAEFARRMIGDLGARNGASVALLRVDGRAIAAQVLLYSGSMSYTWKTAFDAAFAKFSPGALLIDKVTDALLSSGVERIESCATEDSFMAQLWTGRRMTIDLLADVGGERSVNFALAAFGEHAHTWLRGQRDRLRAAHWLPGPKRKNLAVTRG